MRTVRFTVVGVLALGLALGCGSKKEENKEESLETKEFKKVASHMNSGLEELKKMEETVSSAKGGLKNPIKAFGAAKKLLTTFAEVGAVIAALVLPGDTFKSTIVKGALTSVNSALSGWGGDDCDGISCALSRLKAFAEIVDALTMLAKLAGEHGVKIPSLR